MDFIWFFINFNNTGDFLSFRYFFNTFKSYNLKYINDLLTLISLIISLSLSDSLNFLNKSLCLHQVYTKSQHKIEDTFLLTLNNFLKFFHNWTCFFTVSYVIQTSIQFFVFNNLTINQWFETFIYNLLVTFSSICSFSLSLLLRSYGRNKYINKYIKIKYHISKHILLY